MQSIKWKLTFWYSLLLLISLIFWAVIFFFVLSKSLTQEMEQPLIAKAFQIRYYIEDNYGRIPLQDISLDYVTDSYGFENFYAPKVYSRILSPEGLVITKSSNLPENYFLPVDRKVIKDVVDGKNVFRTLHLNPLESLHIFSMPVKVDKKVIAVIEVARSSISVENTLVYTKGILIFVGVLTMLLAIGGGYFISFTLFKPLDQVTHKATEIERTSDLTKRIELTSPDEIGELAKSFNTMMDRLEQAFKTQQQFLADASHELNTPLTSIRSNVDYLIKRGQNEGEVQEVMLAVKKESERMSRLLSDLLLLSQEAEKGGFPLIFSDVELDTLMLETFYQMKKIAPHINLQIGKEDQVLVEGDRDRLKQLLLNLVENAVKYTPKGGTVTLSLWKDESHAYLEVKDTGIGIAPEHIPFIFDRFYRTDKARSRPTGGSGLGLSIAKKIALAHQGDIAARSSLGEGSAFTLMLPLKKED